MGNRVYGEQVYIEATDSTYTTLSGVTKEPSAIVNSTTLGEFGIEILLEVDFDSTPTDNVNFEFNGGLDGTIFSTYPITIPQLDNATDPGIFWMPISNPPAYWYIDSVQTGVTDSHNVRISYREWRIE